MHALGFSLNMLTCLAIVLSTGILVDDAIVEVENIVRHIRMGKSPYDAAMEAADEIGIAVIAISLTIVAIFLPASFMTSIAGQFFKQFGMTVSVQVLFSLLCARLITPMLAAYFLAPRQHSEKADGPVMRLTRACSRGRCAIGGSPSESDSWYSFCRWLQQPRSDRAFCPLKIPAVPSSRSSC